MAGLITSEQATESTKADIGAEISGLKEKYGSNCRVIENIGEFSHVITVTLKEWDIKIKFLISGIETLHIFT
jgi:hypothetical protein